MAKENERKCVKKLMIEALNTFTDQTKDSYSRVYQVSSPECTYIWVLENVYHLCLLLQGKIHGLLCWVEYET